MAPMAPQDNLLSDDNGEQQPAKKKFKKGIIYLSTIPKLINVTKVREVFGQYGEVERIFLQPEEPKGNKKIKRNQPAKHFTEGWVEFKKKRVAKQVAAMLNNRQIAERKRSKLYDFIWNIKYLPRFKWAHLSERLAYERAVRKQRMSTEIAQAKREANFFAHNVDVKERISKRKVTKPSNSNKGGPSSVDSLMHQFSQRKTDHEIIESKKKKLAVVDGKIKTKKKVAHKIPRGPLDDESRKDLLKSLFGSRTSL